MSSERVVEAVRTLLAVHNIPTEFITDAQLLDWTKSTCRDGPKVKFGLVDDDEVRPFELATVAKGKVAGQLYILIGIRIDEQEQPVQQQAAGTEGGALAKLAGRWCTDPVFIAWVAVQLGKGLPSTKEEHAVEFIRQTCGVKSRAELDHNEEARQAFMEKVRKPFMEWHRRTQNV